MVNRLINFSFLTPSKRLWAKILPMGRAVYIIAIVLSVLAALAIARVPISVSNGLAPACVLSGDAAFPDGGVTAQGQQQSCWEHLDRNATHNQVLARFDLPQSAVEPVKYLRTRIGLFDELKLTAVDRDGTPYTRIYHRDDVTLVSGEPLFMVDLPEITSNSRTVYAQFTGLRHNATINRVELYSSDPSRSAGHIHALLFLTLLIGLMCGPILFDVAAWSVLRTPLLAWHAGVSLSFVVIVALRSGLVVEFMPLSLESWRFLLIMALGVTVVNGAMFTRAFIEEECLSWLARRLLPLAGIWAMVVSVVHAISFDFLAPLGGAPHSWGMLPVLVIFAVVLLDAYRKGSRAVRFQMIGWIPLMAAFALQLFSHIPPFGVPTDGLPLFYLGIVAETTVTGLGVAERFYSLRRERDRAVTEARALEQLSERDPLTGLHNRRAIDNRFDDLHRAGYETFALIDLDYFKSINDTAGHVVGDQVLQTIASILREDEHSIAMRLGGEEFLLLMRGADTERRAEHLRRSIPLRVAREITDLDMLVTASMGLVTIPRNAMPDAQLADIYSRADMLLYEAKRNGRNRMLSEKLRAFTPRQAERRGKKPTAAA